jgi:hypothetical protein
MEVVPRSEDGAPEPPVMLRMEGIYKSFGTVSVLNDVDLMLRRGEYMPCSARMEPASQRS